MIQEMDKLWALLVKLPWDNRHNEPKTGQDVSNA